MEVIFVIIDESTSRIGCKQRTIRSSRSWVGINVIYDLIFQFVRRTHSSKTTVLISRVNVTIRTINRVTIKRPTNNWRVCLVLTNFSEVLSLRIKNYVVTNNITEFFRVGDVCVFTTILVIETSEHITTSNVIFGVKFIFKVLVPLEYSCFKGCKLTNCFQTNSSVALGISNTFVGDLDRNNLTFVFTKGSDDSSCLSTKSITVNVYSRSGSICFTRVNDSDRYNTTVNHDRLCQSTFTRVQFDLRSRSVSRSSRGQ